MGGLDTPNSIAWESEASTEASIKRSKGVKRRSRRTGKGC